MSESRVRLAWSRLKGASGFWTKVILRRMLILCVLGLCPGCGVVVVDCYWSEAGEVSACRSVDCPIGLA